MAVEIWKMDTSNDDDGTAYHASEITKPYLAANAINRYEIKSAALLAVAAVAVEVDVSIISDFGNVFEVATVRLTAAGNEEHVIKRIDELSLSELRVVQFQFEDTAEPAGRWDSERFAARMVRNEKGT